MKPILLILFALAFAAVGLATVQDGAQAPTTLTPHQWLEQLVGEWVMVAEGDMGSDGEPASTQMTETVRSLGGRWFLAEGQGEFNGMTVQSVMTLGYDPRQESFVGSWIDTVQTHLWTYVGHLDEEQRVLTLEANGPSFANPSKMAHYRDQIELVSPDHRTLTSSMQGEDGEWRTYMKAEYRRVKR